MQRSASGAPKALSGREEAREQCRTVCSALVLYVRLCTTLQKGTTYLGFMAFTWATVVLLGGFASTLCRDDFAVITTMLLLETARFAATLRLSRLMSRPLHQKHHIADASGSGSAGGQARARTTAAAAGAPALASSSTAHVTGTDASSRGHDQHLADSASTRINMQETDQPGGTQRHKGRQCCRPATTENSLFAASASLQAVMPCLSLSLAVWRMSCSCAYGSTANVAASLWVFYILCIVSSVCALLSLVVLLKAKLYLSSQPLLWQACFDHLCCRGVSGSVLDINDFDFLSWGLQQVAAELRRNEEVPTVFSKESYGLLVHYIFADRYWPLLLGLAMESANPYEQHAAVSAIGYWPEYGRAEMLANTWLLQLLASKLRTGQVGWAAINTLRAIGEWPGGMQALLGVRSLVPHLVKLLQQPTWQQLATVRLLATWLGDEAWQHHFQRSNKKLVAVLSSALHKKGDMRCSIWAAVALHRLRRLQVPLDVNNYLDVNAAAGRKDCRFTYVYPDERKHVDELFKAAGLTDVNWEQLSKNQELDLKP